MLAEIEHLPSPVFQTASLEATLIYHTEGDPQSKFTWETGNTPPVLFVQEADTTLTITLQGATFATSAMTVISGSGITLSSRTDTELSIQIDEPPLNYLNPFIFSLNVDNGSVNGISSPPLFLVLGQSSQDSAIVDLQYDPSDGSFTLDSMPVLASLALLINTSEPPFDITFNLSAVTPDPTVQFHSSMPFIGPSWLTLVSVTTTKLTVEISSAATRFTSIQFVLDVGGVTVTSPDPIIINATIGDGGGS